MSEGISLTELNYAPAAERTLIRPLLWLILMMPAGQVIGEISRQSFFAVAAVTGYPSRVGFADVMGVVGGLLGISISVWVMAAAWIGLRGGRLASLQTACGVMAGLGLALALFTILMTFSRLTGGSSLPAGYQLQYAVTSIGGAIGRAAMPITACVLLGKIRRETPGY